MTSKSQPSAPVLGTPLVPRTGADVKLGRQSPNNPTLDRINNDQGYEPGNVVVISKRACLFKKDGIVEEIEKIAKWLKEHNDNS